MPIYEYVCEKCGKLSDVFQKLNDPPPDKCEGCGADGPLTKCVSRTSFVLKGGGWYSDLYSSAKKDTGTKDSTAPKDSTAKESKPAQSGTSSTPATPASSSTPSGGGTSGSGSGGGSSS